MTNILILGAGFGGISTALSLEKKIGRRSDYKITLVDRNSFHLFTPSLYEVATVYGLIEDGFAQYLRTSVAVPIAEILKNKKVDFIQAEIKEINLKEKYVLTNGGNRFEFDYLVVALGGETEFYGIPGVKDYAFNFKTIDDAVAIYKKILDIRTGKTKTLKIGVIGGGFTGVEVAAELACCANKIIKDCRLDEKCVGIHLFQANPMILEPIGEKARKKIMKRLEEEGVDIHLNSPVTEVKPNSIVTKDQGEFNNFDLIIWAGGVRGSRVLENAGLELTKKGTIEVNEFLQARENEKVFLVGDCATCIDPKTQKPVPAMAYVAFDAGKTAAKNIINHIKGRELEPHRLFYDAWIAPVAGKWAYFHYKGFETAGFLGYLLRQIVDLRHFMMILPFFKALKLFFKDLVIFTKND
mgnify:CR=1 FL=1